MRAQTPSGFGGRVTAERWCLRWPCTAAELPKWAALDPELAARVSEPTTRIGRAPSPAPGASKVGDRHPPGLGEPVVRVAKDEARSDDHHGAHDSPGGQDPARHTLLDVMAVRGARSLVGSPVGRDGGGEGAGCPPIKVGRRSQRHGDQGARAAMKSRAPPAKYRLGGRAIAVNNLLPFDPAAGAPGLGWNVK